MIGRNGAGKTQVLRAAAGLCGEQVQTDGYLYGPKKLGYVFQDSLLFPWLNVLENLLLISPNNENKILGLLEDFNLGKYANYYPYQLSGGSKQKINIIRAFLVEADLILMDEPFVGLDLPQKHELILMIQKIWTKQKSILLVTHDIDEALSLSHQIFYLSKKNKKITKNWDIMDLPKSSLRQVRQETWAINLYLELQSLLESESHEEI